ncbi:hypothetical protein [Nonomuraea jiangxiensis]|uniref:Uncharacterized protein n=1 Tax=Nonomuraea jiangxiensis TaxID=633440 RepID=A0A1G8VB19_9ACTN|nr:hypothetical protein [Nonomuraea jiangxiensis]SDJ63193.1 hypothetical protein SAMN05421869_111259 [Nonomuraea jiangxiensis]
MADHDRNVGSRGEEEAPRDPAPAGTGDTGDLPPDDQLSYGEAPDGPTPRSSGYRPGADTIPPGMPGSGGWERESSFRDFFRQKQAQIIGAGLIGLVVGGLLGGGAVLFVSSVVERNEMHAPYRPGQDFFHPVEPSCRTTPTGVHCVAPPLKMPRPVPTFVPEPTRTG